MNKCRYDSCKCFTSGTTPSRAKLLTLKQSLKTSTEAGKVDDNEANDAFGVAKLINDLCLLQKSGCNLQQSRVADVEAEPNTSTEAGKVAGNEAKDAFGVAETFLIVYLDHIKKTNTGYWSFWSYFTIENG